MKNNFSRNLFGGLIALVIFAAAGNSVNSLQPAAQDDISFEAVVNCDRKFEYDYDKHFEAAVDFDREFERTYDINLEA